jgi:hypothetical protein
MQSYTTSAPSYMIVCEEQTVSSSDAISTIESARTSTQTPTSYLLPGSVAPAQMFSGGALWRTGADHF